MKEKILNKLVISEKEQENFKVLGDNYFITDKLFIKNNVTYSIKILLKDNKITYQLKERNKILVESKNADVIERKILNILGY